MTFALLIGNLARFWKSVTYNLNLTWTVGWAPAALKRGQIVYTKIPYSACMNSFRIQRLDSFHAISHGIPIRPGSGPPRRPNRSATARVGGTALRGPPLVMLHQQSTYRPPRVGAHRQPSYTVRTVRTQNTDFGVTISKFLILKLVIIDMQ